MRFVLRLREAECGLRDESTPFPQRVDAPRGALPPPLSLYLRADSFSALADRTATLAAARDARAARRVFPLAVTKAAFSGRDATLSGMIAPL